MTGIRQPELPAGHDFDYINAEVIEQRLTVRDGRLALPHGTTYRVLVLPETTSLSDSQASVVSDFVKQGGGLLLVSQFTLAADTSAGNRPSFTGAAPAALGRELYEETLRRARERHAPVQAGVFGADMQVHLVNDGPVTIPLAVR